MNTRSGWYCANATRTFVPSVRLVHYENMGKEGFVYTRPNCLDYRLVCCARCNCEEEVVESRPHPTALIGSLEHLSVGQQ
jgi:hypothetical protein